MELHRKSVQLGVIHSLVRFIVGVYEAFDTVNGRVAEYGIAVILARDIAFSACNVLTGLISAPVTVFKLDGLSAVGKSGKLMT